jgi:hypothetical protein
MSSEFGQDGIVPTGSYFFEGEITPSESPVETMTKLVLNSDQLLTNLRVEATPDFVSQTYHFDAQGLHGAYIPEQIRGHFITHQLIGAEVSLTDDRGELSMSLDFYDEDNNMIHISRSSNPDDGSTADAIIKGPSLQPPTRNNLSAYLLARSMNPVNPDAYPLLNQSRQLFADGIKNLDRVPTYELNRFWVSLLAVTKTGDYSFADGLNVLSADPAHFRDIMHNFCALSQQCTTEAQFELGEGTGMLSYVEKNGETLSITIETNQGARTLVATMLFANGFTMQFGERIADRFTPLDDTGDIATIGTFLAEQLAITSQTETTIVDIESLENIPITRRHAEHTTPKLEPEDNDEPTEHHDESRPVPSDDDD